MPIGNIIFSQSDITQVVVTIAAQISADYVGQDIVLVGLLNGAFMFVKDLSVEIERITLSGEGVASTTVDFISVSSYGEERTPGNVRIESDLRRSPVGKHVIVVDEVAETLNTTFVITNHLRDKEPESVRVCVLVSKPDAPGRRSDVELHYVGFSKRNLPFLVGYGMDDKGKHRALSFIAECTLLE